MKLLIVSDTHGHLPTVNKVLARKADVFIHCGDICPNWSWNWKDDGPRQLKWIEDKFIPWVKDLAIVHNLCVIGNHDGCGWPEYGMQLKALGGDHIRFLFDQSITIGSTKFYGTPWTHCPPTLFDINQWAAGMSTDEKLGYAWNSIPDDTNVLISHSPPYGIMDQAKRFDGSMEHIGSQSLYEKVCNLKHLKLHCYGHNHTPQEIMDLYGIRFVNASEKNLLVEIPE